MIRLKCWVCCFEGILVREYLTDRTVCILFIFINLPTRKRPTSPFPSLNQNTLHQHRIRFGDTFSQCSSKRIPPRTGTRCLYLKKSSNSSSCRPLNCHNKGQ